MDAVAEKKVRTFFGEYPVRNIKRGDLLFSPDKEPEGVFCLSSGVVRCYALSKDGLELSINIFKPVSFFPMGWALNGRRSKYYFETLTPVVGYMAPQDVFVSFIKTENDVAFDLLQRLYRGLDGYFVRMESLLSGGAYLKTTTAILIHALRFGNNNGETQTALHLTHSQIADQTGLSRETVTREIKKLQEKHLVSYKGLTLIVHDMKQLERETAE